MQNSLTDKIEFISYWKSRIRCLLAYQYDSIQDYSQRGRTITSRVSQFGDLYGGIWSAWLLPVSVIITSKASDDTNKEILQKLELFDICTGGKWGDYNCVKRINWKGKTKWK